MTSKAHRNWARPAVYWALFLALFIVPFVLFGQALEAYSLGFLSAEVSNPVAMGAAFALLAGDPVLPTPSSIIATLLAGKVGFVAAAIVNAAALCLASLLGYGLGRMGGGAMERMNRRLPASFVNWVQRNGLIAVLLCRPVPVFSEASLVLAGAARHPPRALLLWCCALQAALGVAYAYAGSGWGTDEWNNTAVLAGSVGLPLAGALAVLIATRIQKAKR